MSQLMHEDLARAHLQAYTDERMREAEALRVRLLLARLARAERREARAHHAAERAQLRLRLLRA